MPTTLTLNGNALAARWRAATAGRVAALPRPPRLVIVRARKLVAAAEVGIVAERLRLSEAEGEAALHSLLNGLARDPSADAVLVQTPLPVGWDMQAAFDLVPWHKDVDGLATASAQRRAQGLPAHAPATPAAVLRLLHEEWGHRLAGLNVAVVGNGRVVGGPLRAMLAAAGARVIGIDRTTPQPASLCRQAQVVVTACGVPGLITGSWLQPGADVIDVGLTPEETPEGKRLLRGDVNALSIEGIAARRTPAPGGVGPLTVAQLLGNVAAAKLLPRG
jgi:methylenetetrahydrofolate dehydrogenase (NADP+)/methenyltetrahydrofolate cyclohydrolase